MNSICAYCQNKGTFIHEFSIQYCSIIYPTGLRDERKTALHQGMSCSINCILPAGKSIINVTIPLFKLSAECNATRWGNDNKQQYGIIKGDTALWQVWCDFMMGAQNQSLTYSPSRVS